MCGSMAPQYVRTSALLTYMHIAHTYISPCARRIYQSERHRRPNSRQREGEIENANGKPVFPYISLVHAARARLDAKNPMKSPFCCCVATDSATGSFSMEFPTHSPSANTRKYPNNSIPCTNNTIPPVPQPPYPPKELNSVHCRRTKVCAYSITLSCFPRFCRAGTVVHDGGDGNVDGDGDDDDDAAAATVDEWLGRTLCGVFLTAIVMATKHYEVITTFFPGIHRKH